MKGYTKVIVEEMDDCGAFPIKETFVFSRNNSFESIEDWVDLFNKILTVRGFHSSFKVGIVNEFGEE